MKFELSKSDHLHYQLYKFSKRRSTKIQKIRNTAIVSGSIFLFGLYMYFKIKEVYILLFISAITLIIILAYPLYLRLFYKRHLSKIVDENCKNAIGKTNSLEIVDGFIVLKEDGSESELKLAIEEIKEIIEIQNNYFAVVDDVSSIIMPKNNEAHEFVNVLVNNYNIKLKRELNWKWK